MATPTGGRFVFTVRASGGESTTCGASTEEEAIALGQRLVIHGIDFENPYTKNACHWQFLPIELTDVEDPDGTKEGMAKKIMKQVTGGAPVRTYD